MDGEFSDGFKRLCISEASKGNGHLTVFGTQDVALLWYEMTVGYYSDGTQEVAEWELMDPQPDAPAQWYRTARTRVAMR